MEQQTGQENKTDMEGQSIEATSAQNSRIILPRPPTSQNPYRIVALEPVPVDVLRMMTIDNIAVLP